jgi:Flp pilus assembly protein TadD
MSVRRSGRRWGAMVFTVALFGGVCGCGAGQKGPTQPENPPAFDDEPGEVAPASSAKVQEGIDAIKAGDFAAAKAALVEAVAAEPKDAQAQYYLGVSLEGLGDPEAARQAYERAIAEDPQLVEARINLSGILIDAGDGKRGLAVVEEGLKLAPEHPALLMNHALALELTEDYAGALTAYAKAVEKNPDDVQLRYAYAENLARAGQAEAAKSELQKVLAATDDLQLTVAAAQLAGKVGDNGTCLRVFDRLLKGQSTPDLLVRRGRCKADAGDAKGAEVDYRAAIAQDANFPGAHYYLGLLLEAQGKAAEAKKSLTKAVETGKGTPFEDLARKSLAERK